MNRRAFFRSLGGAVAAAMLPFKEIAIDKIFPAKAIGWDDCGSLTNAQITYLTPTEIAQLFEGTGRRFRCTDEGYRTYMDQVMKLQPKTEGIYDFLMRQKT